MKKCTAIISFFLAFLIAGGQANLRTILPDRIIRVEEPFRIQFVVEHSKRDQRFGAPDFDKLRILYGPEVFEGTQTIDGMKVPITNYVYTLVADHPGRFKIAAPVVNQGGRIYSGEAVTLVIERKRMPAKISPDNVSAYTLRPGEDPYQKIRDNLFVKLFVSKRTCYVGEPIVATFKLFSRLQSKSEIVKNPGFYGFSVHDMINLEDKIKETELIGGKEFDVHTIRKLQLYPIQAGDYVIDEMKIENKVEFSRSVVNKKTEQQISEGVLNEDDQTLSPGAELFETTLATAAVRIKVNPLPVGSAGSANFNGAVGQFTIQAALEKKDLDKNEEGFLLITIEGKGNFTQLTAPIIQWPKEVEGFDPSVKDFLDKRLVPLTGARIFRYPFISSQPGKWKIPAVRFSFFNAARNSFQTISSDSVFVNVSAKSFAKPLPQETEQQRNKVPIEVINRKVSIIAFAVVALFIVVAITYWSLRGNKDKKVPQTQPAAVQSVDALLDALKDESLPDKVFYPAIQRIVWTHVSEIYNLSGTKLNKGVLRAKLEQKGNEISTIHELTALFDHFEQALFTNMGIEENKIDLIDRTKNILKQIKT